MPAKRKWIRIWLAELYVFGLAYCCLSVILLLVGGELLLRLALALLPVFALMVVVRLKVRQPLLFVPMLAALTIWPFFTPLAGGLQFGLFLLLAVLFGYSLYRRLHCAYWTLGWSFFLLQVGISLSMCLLAWLITLYYAPAMGLVPYLLGWVIVSAFACFATIQTDSVDVTLHIVGEESAQPLGTIRRFNNRLLLMLLVALSLFVALSFLLPLANILPLLGSGLLALLRLLFSRGSDAQPELPPTLLPEESGPGDIILPTNGNETSPILAFILQVVEYVFMAVIAAGLVALLVFAVYKVYRGLTGSTVTVQDGDEKEFIGPEFTLASLTRPFGRLRERLPRFGRSEAEKIRRKYYTTVRSHIKRGAKITSQNTPADIAEALREKQPIDELTRQYEKARYSNGMNP